MARKYISRPPVPPDQAKLWYKCPHAACKEEAPAMNTLLDPLVSEFETAEEEASYTAWLRSEIAKSIADPRPSIPHDEAMARIRRTIEALKNNAQDDD